MSRVTVRQQRRMLRGWIKWVPVVVIPFSILFFHTWLNIQILRADYVLRELDAEAREWNERLNYAGMAETYHEDPNMLADQAEQMAFVQPSPGQREIIYYDPTVRVMLPEDEAIALAQLDNHVQPGPAASESALDQARAAAPENTTLESSLLAAPQAAPMATSPMDAAPASVSAVPVAEAPALPPATDGFGEATPMIQTPVPLSLDPDTAQVVPEATKTVHSEVVLELPEDAYVEDVVNLEGAMESLESL